MPTPFSCQHGRPIASAYRGGILGGWQTTTEQQLDEVQQLIARRIKDRDRKNDEERPHPVELIPQLFPEKPDARTRAPHEVVDATGFTREYVARIRDGKVKPS
jgi:hypothetical protein